MWNKNHQFILYLAFSTALYVQPALADDASDASPRYDLKVHLFPRRPAHRGAGNR